MPRMPGTNAQELMSAAQALVAGDKGLLGPQRCGDHYRHQVDTGAKDMAGHPGEKITEGLDGVRGERFSTGWPRSG